MVVRSSDCKLSATASAPFVLVLLVMTSSAQCNDIAADTADCRPAEHRFLYAREAAHAGDFDRAMQEYARLVLDEPDNVDYIFGYAQVLFWSDNLERSPRFLERARKLAPDYEDIWKLEYQARISATRNEPIASFDQFRQMAANNFPSAEWHRVIDKAISRKYRWEFSASRELLDNGAPDWEQLDVLFGRNLTEKVLATLSASTMNRFGTRDTQFGFGGSLEVGENWTATVGFTISSSPNFLPDTGLDLELRRRFEHGWAGGVRWRRRNYEISSVNSFGLITERYIRKYRIAYSLDNARLSYEQAVVHALTVNFYANSGSRLGVILAAGEEVEIGGPGQLLKTDVNSIALTGRHPINKHLGFGWRLATHRQGPFYRRNSIGISISGGF